MKASPDTSSDLVANLDESIVLPQPGCPTGKIGVAAGEMLERSNRAVIEASFDLLDLHATNAFSKSGGVTAVISPRCWIRRPGSTTPAWTRRRP